MATTRDPLRCGGCGEAEFGLYYESIDDVGRFGGGGAHQGTVIARCLKCNEESRIEPAPAALHTDGSLCGGWGK